MCIGSPQFSLPLPNEDSTSIAHPGYSTTGRLSGPAWQDELWTRALARTLDTVESQLRSCADRPWFIVQKATRRVDDSPSTKPADLHVDGSEMVVGFFIREDNMQAWLESHRVQTSRDVRLDDAPCTKHENPDGKAALVDWYPPGNTGHAECSTLHVVTVDIHTRFVKLRTAVRVRAGYELRARLGDWIGHAPAYLRIVNQVVSHGVSGCLPRLLSVLSEDVDQVQSCLTAAYEVVVASPGQHLIPQISKPEMQA